MFVQFTGILLLTFRELWAKKIVMGLFIVSSLVLLTVTFALNLDVVEGSLAGLRLFGQDAQIQSDGENMMTLDRIVFAVESVVAGAAYWLGILLSLFATAPLYSALLESGHVDLLLSKPISRGRLLGGHILGVWASMAVLALYLLGGVWLIMSLKTGVWNPQFLLSIGIVVAMFGVMYAVVVFIGVWTQSTALSLIVAYGLIFVSGVLAASESINEQISAFWRPVFNTMYHVLPNFAEVTVIVSNLSRGEAVTSWYPLFSSLAFGLVMYGIAVVWFNRRDF